MYKTTNGDLSLDLFGASLPVEHVIDPYIIDGPVELSTGPFYLVLHARHARGTCLATMPRDLALGQWSTVERRL